MARDVGTCDTPYGSLQPALGPSIALTYWGGVTGLDGQPKARCRQKTDIIVPAPHRAAAVSPFWGGASP